MLRKVSSDNITSAQVRSWLVSLGHVSPGKDRLS